MQDNHYVITVPSELYDELTAKPGTLQEAFVEMLKSGDAKLDFAVSKWIPSRASEAHEDEHLPFKSAVVGSNPTTGTN